MRWWRGYLKQVEKGLGIIFVEVMGGDEKETKLLDF
jgi:hypothetical protein